MKKCDHFKDLILTDYIDGELDKNTAGSLKAICSTAVIAVLFLKKLRIMRLCLFSKPCASRSLQSFGTRSSKI